MLPSEAFQVTDLLDVDPWTDAVKESVPLAADLAEVGEIVTEVTAGSGGGGFGLGLPGAAATVTGADADLVGSATLVAVTIPDPAVAGAVYSPVEVIVPIVVDHVTARSVVVPWTVAVNCTRPFTAGDADAGDSATELTGAPADEAFP